MAYEVNGDIQRACLAAGILDKYAKQLATISCIAQKELQEVLGYGAASTIFALADQAVVRALAFDASNFDNESWCQLPAAVLGAFRQFLAQCMLTN